MDTYPIERRDTRKILYLIDGLGTGGAERSLAELLPGLRPAGITPLIACLHRRAEGVEKEIVGSGVDVRFLSSSPPVRVRQIRALIRHEKPDLVHTVLFNSSLLGRLGAARTHVPVLTSLVNTSYDARRLDHIDVNPRLMQAVRVVDGWTARHLTTHFHAITHAVKDAALRDLHLAPERMTVIPRGRDPLRLGYPSPERRERARSNLGLSPDDEVVVSVGRQEVQKGHVYLLQAMAPLIASRPHLRLLLAGRRGHTSEQLERLISELPPGRVMLLGHCDDIGEVLAAADVFAFPSLYEGLGGAVLEAMSLGLPLVASDIPALREITDPDANALLVPPASPAALAEAIERLLDDPDLRQRFGARSRQIFERDFTLDRSTTQMLALYERIWSGRFGGRLRAPSGHPQL